MDTQTNLPLPLTMKAMVLEIPRKALVLKILSLPIPLSTQVLIKIIACGICRTDLHIMDSELANPKLPLIPGHEIVGVVEKTGSDVIALKRGDIVGVPWVGYTCGHCRFCLRDQENLCENALFTGYTMDGGFAGYTVAYEQYCLPLPSGNAQQAPLLCAGLIGYRSYSMTGPHVSRLGIYGFGAAAHILVQAALHQKKEVYAFTRTGDLESQAFALKLGATWAGDSSMPSPLPLDAAIIFASDGALIPKALVDTDKGGTVVCGGIHMSDIPSFSYPLLWGERVIRSVANLTRKDGLEFLALAQKIPIRPEVCSFPLEAANEALLEVRHGKIHGAAVLVM